LSLGFFGSEEGFLAAKKDVRDFETRQIIY
jgi:hypothetical protein